MKLAKISIVFPNLEGDKNNLKKFLTSVKNLAYQKSLIEVIMVDNDSKDDSCEFVKNNFSLVKIIRL